VSIVNEKFENLFGDFEYISGLKTRYENTFHEKIELRNRVPRRMLYLKVGILTIENYSHNE